MSRKARGLVISVASVMALSGSASFLGGCGEDGPLLYFIVGPSVTRDSSDHVVVTGELHTVIAWPSGDEFCVNAVWEEPVPPGESLLMQQQCSTDPVPREKHGSGWEFTLRSSQPVQHPDAGQPPWSLTVSLTSDHHENRDNEVSETFDVP